MKKAANFCSFFGLCFHFEKRIKKRRPFCGIILTLKRRRFMTEKHQAFIFDMDGTIVDSLGDLCDGVNYSLKLNGFPLITLEQCRSYIGDGSVKLIERALGNDKLRFTKKVFDDYYQYYLSHCTDHTFPYENLVSALDYAKKNNILLFIDTNKPVKMANEVADKCFGKGYFDKIIGIPLDGKVKPDPEAFKEGVRDYNLDYKKCAYFGDSGTDILTAYNLGIEDIYSVSWGYKSRQFLETYKMKPKRIIDDPLDIIKIVNGLF